MSKNISDIQNFTDMCPSKVKSRFPGFMLLVYVKCNESETPKIFVISISANLAIFPKKSTFLHHLDYPV